MSAAEDLSPASEAKKSKYFSTKSPDRAWDYIVIGSGMGGMATASILAKLGKKVLVLEQHYVPGGFTHTFRRKKWVWDVGVHAVGEVTSKASIGKLLSFLTDGKLTWTTLGPVYDEFYFPDQRIDFPNDRNQFIENLYDAFPNERRAIDDYILKIKEVAGVMRGYYLSRAFPKGLASVTDRLFAKDAARHFNASTQEVLAKLTDNEKLRTVFAAQWGYYGSPPSRSSFAMQALVVRHFWHGGYYPEGGAKRIAENLLQTVVDADGWTRINADVQEILVERGKAVGVRLTDGEVIRAKAVVSAAGARATVERLLPESERKAMWAQSIAGLSQSSAHVCLNLGFKGDIREAGASAANKWFYETWDTEIEAWNVEDPKSEAPVLYTSFPSLKDPEHDAGKDQIHTGEVVTFVPWDTFAKWQGSRWMKRGDTYDELKDNITQRMLDQTLRHLPGLKDKLVLSELSTPLSTAHFTRAPRGAIYGLEPTPARYQNPWLRPRTPVKNLYMSGSDMASVGVIGAFVGGVLAAVAAEPVGAIKLFRAL